MSKDVVIAADSYSYIIATLYYQYYQLNIEFITEDYYMITNVYLGIVYTFSYFCRNRQKTSYQVNFEFSATKVKKNNQLMSKI